MKENDEISEKALLDDEYVSIPMFEEFSDQDMYPSSCNDLFGVIG